jgi:hypothetical protein
MIPKIISLSRLFLSSRRNLCQIAYNVPAVYDIFAVAIRETVGFQQPQKCVWSERGNGAQRNDLANERPSPLLRAQHIQSCYAMRPTYEAVRQGRRTVLFFFSFKF